MARDSSSSSSSGSGILAACMALLQWIILTVVTIVKRGVRFFCRVCASSTASKFVSAECIDLEAGRIMAMPEAVCGDEDREEQDEMARTFETIDVIAIVDMQKPNENDDYERIEIVVVGESITGAPESCTKQEEEASLAVVGVDAAMTQSEDKDEEDEGDNDEDEDTVKESESDITSAHSAWNLEEGGAAAAADTQFDFDLDTVSDAVSSSPSVSSHSTMSEDDQDTKAPLMTDSTRIDSFEEISSLLDQQQGQREQEHEMELEFSETDSSGDDESKMPVGLDAKSQEQDDADSGLDMVTDTSSPPSTAASSGSDCKFEKDDAKSSITTTSSSSSSSSTFDDSEDAKALYHEQQQQPEQETTDNSSEEGEEEKKTQLACMEPTAVDARTATTRLKSYHAITIHIDNREYNRRLLEARAKALRYSDSLEYKQMRAASLARRASLRKAAASKPRFLF